MSSNLKHIHVLDITDSRSSACDNSLGPLTIFGARAQRNTGNVRSLQTERCALRRVTMVSFSDKPSALSHLVPQRQRSLPVSVVLANRYHRKTPWRLSSPQKRRQRKRLRAVDAVVATLDQALSKRGLTLGAIERWKKDMPGHDEMVPRDKYTIFDRKVRGYRKSIHSECRSRLQAVILPYLNSGEQLDGWCCSRGW